MAYMNPHVSSEIRVVSETGSTARYGVVLESDHTYLEPRGLGSIADSRTPQDSYAYRNGGALYRAAVDRAKAIQAAR